MSFLSIHIPLKGESNNVIYMLGRIQVIAFSLTLIDGITGVQPVMLNKTWTLNMLIPVFTNECPYLIIGYYDVLITILNPKYTIHLYACVYDILVVIWLYIYHIIYVMIPNSSYSIRFN